MVISPFRIGWYIVEYQNGDWEIEHLREKPYRVGYVGPYESEEEAYEDFDAIYKAYHVEEE